MIISMSFSPYETVGTRRHILSREDRGNKLKGNIGEYLFLIDMNIHE